MYGLGDSTACIDDLLAEIESNPAAIFWG